MKQMRRTVRCNEELFETLLLTGVLCWILLRDIDKFYSINVINDEFGYWSIAASWAGNNWTSFLSTTPYYSYGYSLLLLPLFLLRLSPESMYRIAITLNVVMLIGSFILTIKCGEKLWHGVSRKMLIFLSFLVTLYTNNIIQAQFAWTETLLYFLYWLLLWFIIYVVECGSSKGTISVVLIATYMYSVHQRTVGILISVVLLFILLFICKKIGFRQIVLSFSLFLFTFLIISFVKKCVINAFFSNEDLVAMNNYSGQASKIRSIFTDSSGFMQLISSICGKLFYLVLSSFFLVVIPLFRFGKTSVQDCINILKGKKSCNWINIFIFMSFCATFLISAISMYIPAGRLDILIYGRYTEMLIGPLLLYGMICYVNEEKSKKYIIAGIIFSILIAVVVNKIWVSLDTTVYNGICVTSFIPFFVDMIQISGTAFRIVFFFASIGILSLIVGERKGKSRFYKLFIPTFIGFLWLCSSGDFDITSYQKEIHHNIQEIAVSSFFQKADRIFYLNDGITSDIYGKYLQFATPNKEIEVVEFDDLQGVETGVLVVSCDSNYSIELASKYRLLERNDWIAIFSLEEGVEDE